MLLNENGSKLQVLLDPLNNGVLIFGMRFPPSKCELLWPGRVYRRLNVVVQGKHFGETTKSCILIAKTKEHGEWEVENSLS